MCEDVCGLSFLGTSTIYPGIERERERGKEEGNRGREGKREGMREGRREGGREERYISRRKY